MQGTYGDLCTAGDTLRAIAGHAVLNMIEKMLARGLLYEASEWHQRLVTTFGQEDPL
jgi:4-aminobutyrate aminotransferase-like enzyme